MKRIGGTEVGFAMIIVNALAMGAAAAAKDTASQAVKDAYAALKSLIVGKFQSTGADIDRLESSPESETRRAVITEELAKEDLSRDEDVVSRVRARIECVETHDPTAARVIGVDLNGLKGMSLEITRITAHGPGAIGVRGENIDTKGDVKISNVEASSPN